MFFSPNVSAFDPKVDKYVLFKKWGTEGSGNGEFQRIHDFYSDPTENISTLLTEMVIAFKYSIRMELL